jgi:hypothetical protein
VNSRCFTEINETFPTMFKRCLSDRDQSVILVMMSLDKESRHCRDGATEEGVSPSAFENAG